MLTAILIIGSAVVLLAAGLLLKTFRFASRQITCASVPPLTIPDGAMERLAAAIRFATVSYDNPGDPRFSAGPRLLSGLRPGRGGHGV